MITLRRVIKQRAKGIIKRTNKQTKPIPRHCQPSMMKPLFINRDLKKSQEQHSMWRTIIPLHNRKNPHSTDRSNNLRKLTLIIMVKSSIQRSIQANREATRVVMPRVTPSSIMTHTIKSMMKRPIRESIQGTRHALLGPSHTPVNRGRLNTKLTITEKRLHNLLSIRLTHQGREEDIGRSPSIMRLRSHFLKRGSPKSSSDRREITRRTMQSLKSRGIRELENITLRKRVTNREIGTRHTKKKPIAHKEGLQKSTVSQVTLASRERTEYKGILRLS